MLTSVVAFADEPLMAIAREVVVSADGLYVDVQFAHSECTVQRERTPLAADVAAPVFTVPAATHAPRRRRELQIDTWYVDRAGHPGITTDVLQVHHGALVGDLSLIRERVLPYCDLTPLSAAMPDMPRAGRKATAALLAVSPD